MTSIKQHIKEIANYKYVVTKLALKITITIRITCMISSLLILVKSTAHILNMFYNYKYPALDNKYHIYNVKVHLQYLLYENTG